MTQMKAVVRSAQYFLPTQARAFTGPGWPALLCYAGALIISQIFRSLAFPAPNLPTGIIFMCYTYLWSLSKGSQTGQYVIFIDDLS